MNAVIPVTYKDEVHYALIDPDDFWPVLEYAHEIGNRWRLAKEGYVVLSEGRNSTLLHRFLMDCKPGDGMYVDHISRNRLDNRRKNLRLVTPGQSAQNLGPKSNNMTGHRGVMTMKTTHGMKYQARIVVAGHRYYLGTFDTPDQAAKAAAEARARHAPHSREALLGIA